MATTLKSVLKPPESIYIGLAEAAAVYTIYNSSLPNHADIRSAPAHNTDIEAARKQAAWKSAAVLGFVFLLTRDLNSFLLGGLALGGIDYLVKHSNGVSPATGKLSMPGAQVTPGAPLGASAANAEAYPMPSYEDSSQPLSYSYAG
jgi:hypothetical protein